MFSSESTNDERYNRSARKDDWKTMEMPEQNEKFILEADFTDEQIEVLKRGHIPKAMEDKWFRYAEGDTLYIHRSWGGICLFIIEFRDDGKHLVTVNRDPEQYSRNDLEYDFRWLTRCLARWIDSDYSYYDEWLGETVESIENAKMKPVE